MTRETKIGLLVGLAFIIVIGILLSDHLTSATEPQQAQLVQVAGNVRTGVTVPGESAANPPITTVAPPQQAPVTPQQQVPLKQELTPPKPPVEIVQIGVQPQPPIVLAPPAPPALPVIATPNPASPEHPVHVAAPGGAPASASGGPGSSLVSVAESMGEEVVGLDGRKIEQTPTRLAVAAPPPGSRKYKAEAGDSVSRMAAKFLGGDTRTNRDAIIAANPSLQQDANLVIVDRSYIIPPAPQAAAVAAAPAATAAPAAIQVSSIPTPMPPPAANATEVPVAPSAPEHFYIVKAGDTLTGIAVAQLGSAGGVPALMDLNKDILKGKDTIRPSMKLRLPAKPLASAE